MDNLSDELHCSLCNEPRSAPAAVITRASMISPLLQRRQSTSTPSPAAAAAKRVVHLGPGMTVLGDGTALLDISSVTTDGLKQLCKRLVSCSATSLIISQLDKSAYLHTESQLMNAFVAFIPTLPSCLTSLDASGVKSKKAISMLCAYMLQPCHAHPFPPLMHFYTLTVAVAVVCLLSLYSACVR